MPDWSIKTSRQLLGRKWTHPLSYSVVSVFFTVIWSNWFKYSFRHVCLCKTFSLRVNGAHLLLEFLTVDVTLVPIFNESQNVTCVSLLFHFLNSFSDATILPFCLTHAHYFFLYIQKLVWLKWIKHLPDHLLVTVHNPTYQPWARKWIDKILKCTHPAW